MRIDDLRDLSTMMTADFSDVEMVEFFQAHPALRARFVALARAMGNSELEEADAAEEVLVDEMRLLGREALQGWAERRVAARSRKFASNLICIAKVKKTPLAHEIW